MKRRINPKVRGLSIDLDRQGTKTKKGVWFDLAERVSKPVRKRAEINLYRLSEAAEINKGKLLVVPGKVLSGGEAKAKMEVACMSCSKSAREKITNAGGIVIGINELMDGKHPENKIAIVQ